MAYIVKEQLGRTAQLTDTLAVRRKFLVEGTSETDDEIGALDHIGTNYQEYNYTGAVTPMYLRSITVSEELREEPTHFWLVEAEYGPTSIAPTASRPPVETNKAEFSFSASAPSEHILLAKELMWHGYSRNAQLTDPGLFINIEHSGGEYSVRGLDLSPPPPSFQVTWYPDGSTIEAASFSKNLLGLVGKVNSDNYTIQGATYAPGELMLVSIEGSKRTEEDWQVTFAFSYQPNETGLTLPDFYEPLTTDLWTFDKKGHHYFWSIHVTDVVGDPWQSLYLQYSLAVVQRIYDEIPFSTSPGLSVLNGALI